MTIIQFGIKLFAALGLMVFIIGGICIAFVAYERAKEKRAIKKYMDETRKR